MPDLPSRSAPPPVRQLPAQLANQLAAGEVVARPASAVKELIENAIDAGASTLSVDVDAGGVERIVVVDDGHGMREHDARLALERHATSKIRTVDDLNAIATLGFRGEALPSIASVSRFVLRTRTGDAEAGTEIRVDGGGEAHIGPCGCAPGTRVEAADLFFNVPARRKFLRAASTESAHVTDAVLRAALAHPEIAVTLRRDGRVARQWRRAASRLDRAQDALRAPGLWPCLGGRGPARVEAFLSAPDKARTGTTGLVVLVNGRPVQDRAIARAVAQAYGDALPRGSFPIGVVYLELPPDLVDVNVHPQKAEVRFAHARAVTSAVYAVVRDALAARLGAPTSPSPTGWLRPDDAPPAPPWEWSGSGAVAETTRSADLGRKSAAPVATDAPHAPPTLASPVTVSPGGPRPALRFAGMLRDRWLLCEAPDALWVVDAQAAEARVALQAATREQARGPLASQRLLFPVLVPCDAAEAGQVETGAEAIARLGFDVRLAGEQRLAVHALPRSFATAPPEAMLRVLLAALGAPGVPVDHTLQQMARLSAAHRPAVAADTQARRLLDGLEVPGAIDPVVFRVPYATLERA